MDLMLCKVGFGLPMHGLHCIIVLVMFFVNNMLFRPSCTIVTSTTAIHSVCQELQITVAANSEVWQFLLALWYVNHVVALMVKLVG